MSATLAPVTNFEVSNPEDLVHAVRSATLEPCLLKQSPMVSRLERVVCPQVTLDFATIGSTFLFTGVTAPDCYTLMYILDCPTPGKAFNFEVEYQGGYMGLYQPGGCVDSLAPMRYSNATLTVPVDVFHAEVEQLFPGIPDRALKNGVGFRVGVEAQQDLRRLLMEVKLAISDPTMPLAGLPARAALEKRLLDVFLGALHDSIPDGGVSSGPWQRQAGKKLRQARDLLEGSIHHPVHLDTLCRELRISRRGLEVMFRTSFGTTPARYLMCQRLNGVRRDLLAADPDSALVKEAALHWGFLHMGHFGQSYRALFGETPRATLERI